MPTRVPAELPSLTTARPQAPRSPVSATSSSGRRVVAVVRNLALLAAGLLAGLALLEVGLRLATPNPNKQVNATAEPRFGWANVPGFRGYWSAWPEYGDVPVRINGRGLRDDREIPYAKPAGTFRIFLVGDSFIEEKQVPREETFPYLLEKMLNADRSPVRFEVLNAGVSGFATDQEVLLYELEGTRYEADLVLVGFFGNDDVTDSYGETTRGTPAPKPYFQASRGALDLTDFPVKIEARAGEQLTFWVRLRRFLQHNSRVYFLARTAMPRLAPGLYNGVMTTGLVAPLEADSDGWEIPPHYFIHALPAPAEIERALAIEQALFLRLKAGAARHGARVAVVSMPAHYQVNDGRWQRTLLKYPAMKGLRWDLARPDSVLQPYLEAHGILYLYLAPELRRQWLAKGRPLYGRVDTHMNAEGYLLVAQLTHDWLVGTGQVPR